MSVKTRIIHNHFSLWIIMILALSACQRLEEPTNKVQPAAGYPDDAAGGLTADAQASLSSLEKIDDYPFYVMHYLGDYNYPLPGTSLPMGTVFSCSLFTSLGGGGDKFYGRNFDWDYSPAMLLFTDPPDGYASVSMVDLTFLGIDPTSSTNLTYLPPDERTMLLKAPSMPFDGMNEYGLAIGMAAVPDEYLDDASFDSSKPGIGSIGIIRQILDHARDIEEAKTIFQQYNIDFSGGPPIHYLVADPGGNAALIEFYQGEMIIITNEDAWHLATNHLRCIAKSDGGCPRYHILSERLKAQSGQLNPSSAMQLLADVKQSSTQWSAVYNLTQGTIQVVINREYKQIFTFELKLIHP